MNVIPNAVNGPYSISGQSGQRAHFPQASRVTFGNHEEDKHKSKPIARVASPDQFANSKTTGTKSTSGKRLANIFDNLGAGIQRWLKKMHEMDTSQKTLAKEYCGPLLHTIQDKNKPLPERLETLSKLMPGVVSLEGKELVLLEPQLLDQLIRNPKPEIREHFLSELAKFQTEQKTDFRNKSLGMGSTIPAIVLYQYLPVFSDTQSKELRDKVESPNLVKPYFGQPEQRLMVLDIIEKMLPSPLPESFATIAPDLYKNARYLRYSLAQAFANDDVEKVRNKALELMASSEQPPEVEQAKQ